jgi:hypothetical protein
VQIKLFPNKFTPTDERNIGGKTEFLSQSRNSGLETLNGRQGKDEGSASIPKLKLDWPKVCWVSGGAAVAFL